MGIPRGAGLAQGERKGQQSGTPAETSHSASAAFGLHQQRGKSVVFLIEGGICLVVCLWKLPSHNTISVDS